MVNNILSCPADHYSLCDTLTEILHVWILHELPSRVHYLTLNHENAHTRNKMYQCPGACMHVFFIIRLMQKVYLRDKHTLHLELPSLRSDLGILSQSSDFLVHLVSKLFRTNYDSGLWSWRSILLCYICGVLHLFKKRFNNRLDIFSWFILNVYNEQYENIA